MKRILIQSTIVAALMLAACGADSGVAPSSQGELNACELLPSDTVAQLLGYEIAKASQTMSTASGEYAYSQCSYTPVGRNKRMDVQVQRSGKRIEQSRQDDANKWRAEDDGTGMSIEFAAAIENGRDVEGFGGVAYTFEMDESTHFVRYWDKRYQVHLSMSHKGIGKEKTLQACKAAAQVIIERLKG